MSGGRPARERLVTRASTFGLALSAELAAAFAAYADLLRFWNRRVNLTALGLDPLSDAAIDRLLLEPLSAARWFRDSDHCLIDIGSGSGSPAIPLLLAHPGLAGILVEQRAKKAAFLRDALRELGLATSSSVESANALDLAHERVLHRADVLTVRAVLLDEPMLDAVWSMIGAAGRGWFFGDPASIQAALAVEPRLEAVETAALLGDEQVAAALTIVTPSGPTKN
jgi:16S rRNA G527 N7-methylase RsmG